MAPFAFFLIISYFFIDFNVILEKNKKIWYTDGTQLRKGGVFVWKRKEGKIWIAVHLCLLFAALSFPLYRYVTQTLPSFFTGCLLHDHLFLYCPLCGGTRAVEALLHGRLVEAFSQNAYVVLLILVALILDAVALVRLAKGKETVLRLPGYFWILLAVIFVAWWILRNVLLIVFLIDPVGDLGAFWTLVRGATAFHIL